MKQKIVVKVSMTSAECRNKAFQTVSKIKGLISVAIEGPKKDRVTVVGEDIDIVWLLDKLRKKVGDANIVTLEEIKPPVPPKPDQDKITYYYQPAFPQNPLPNPDQDKIICYCQCQPAFPQNPPPYSYPCYPVLDPDPSCTIM